MSEEDARLAILVVVVAEALALSPDEVGGSDTFLSLGGDSLAALCASEGLLEHGYEIDPNDLLDEYTLERVSKGLKTRLHPNNAVR